MNCDAMISKVATEKSLKSFTEDYQKNANAKDLLEEGLGMALASWSEWSGDVLMRVFRAALEDANFHEEAEQVEQMLEKYK